MSFESCDKSCPVAGSDGTSFNLPHVSARSPLLISQVENHTLLKKFLEARMGDADFVQRNVDHAMFPRELAMLPIAAQMARIKAMRAKLGLPVTDPTG